MGAISKSEITKQLSLILMDIHDALDRGVTLDEIAQAIVKLEPTRTDTPRRSE